MLMIVSPRIRYGKFVPGPSLDGWVLAPYAIMRAPAMAMATASILMNCGRSRSSMTEKRYAKKTEQLKIAVRSLGAVRPTETNHVRLAHVWTQVKKMDILIMYGQGELDETELGDLKRII